MNTENQKNVENGQLIICRGYEKGPLKKYIYSKNIILPTELQKKKRSESLIEYNTYCCHSVLLRVLLVK